MSTYESSSQRAVSFITIPLSNLLGNAVYFISHYSAEFIIIFILIFPYLPTQLKFNQIDYYE